MFVCDFYCFVLMRKNRIFFFVKLFLECVYTSCDFFFKLLCRKCLSCLLALALGILYCICCVQCSYIRLLTIYLSICHKEIAFFFSTPMDFFSELCLKSNNGHTILLSPFKRYERITKVFFFPFNNYIMSTIMCA